MKNKFLKVSLIFVSIITILILSNKYIIQKVQADSGWDSSYDSGGSWGGSSSSSWDSGSSWSSSSDSSGSSEFGIIDLIMILAFDTFFYCSFGKIISGLFDKNRKQIPTILFILRLILCILSVILYSILPIMIVKIFTLIDFMPVIILMIYSILGKGRSYSNRKSNNKLIIKNILQKGLMSSTELLKVANSIPNFNIEEFNFKAYQIFYDVQIAWMNFDYDKLKELLTDELYNTYLMDLEALKVKNQKNTMKDFELVETKLINLKEENNTYIAQVLLNVKFYDYIENINTGRILRGTNYRKLHNTYILTFIKSKDEVKENYCPNCGAKVEGNQTGICEYCNSKLINKTYNWVMSKKEKISQR